MPMPTRKNAPKPDDITPISPSAEPPTSRRSTGPSWSTSSSCTRNASSERLHVIWMANTMFSHPTPNTSSTEHMSVVVHAVTPTRRHSWRTASTMPRCKREVDRQERPVRTQPEHVAHAAVDEDRHRHPMAGRGFEQPALPPGRVADAIAGDEERPVVADEPLVPADHEPHDEGDADGHVERALGAPVGGRPGDGAPGAGLERELFRHGGRAYWTASLVVSGYLGQRRRTTMRHHSSTSCRALRAMAGSRKNCDRPDGRK